MPDGRVDPRQALDWITKNVDRSGGGWPVRKAGTRGHHVDPFAYMRDVFQKINAHPRSRLAELARDHRVAQRTADAC